MGADERPSPAQRPEANCLLRSGGCCCFSPPLRGGGANDCLATVPRLAVLPKRLAPLIPGSRPSSRVLRGCMSGVAPLVRSS